MCNDKYHKLVVRIFWFTLPLVISILGYLVVNNFNIMSAVRNSNTKNELRCESQDKLWDLFIVTNEKQHNTILVQIKGINDKIDRLHQNNYGFIPSIDTTTFYTYKNNLDTLNNEFLW